MTNSHTPSLDVSGTEWIEHVASVLARVAYERDDHEGERIPFEEQNTQVIEVYYSDALADARALVESGIIACEALGKHPSEIDREHPRRLMDPWVPMTEPIDLKHIGKLGEEASELAGICCRIVIQGIDEQDPTSEKSNRKLLEDEIADVNANVRLVVGHFGLDTGYIDERSTRKMRLLAQWHGALR